MSIIFILFPNEKSHLQTMCLMNILLVFFEKKGFVVLKKRLTSYWNKSIYK